MPYPITELFAWVIDDPSGKLAIMGYSKGVLPMQAVTSKQELAERPELAEFAKLCAQQTGYPVRLVRFTVAQIMREFEGTTGDER